MASRKPNSSSMTPVKGSASPSSPVVSVGSSSPVISVGSSSPAGSGDSPASAGSGNSPASAGSVGSAASATAVGSSASASAVDPPVSLTAADDSACGMQLAMKLLVDLQDANLRGNALLELCKVYAPSCALSPNLLRGLLIPLPSMICDHEPVRREKFQDFGLLLWQSFGTMAILLQEVIGIYPFLSPPTLTSAQSNRACNALALLQCVASHPRTRRSFVRAHFPLYLYSFLTTNCKLRPFEYLRLTCLGVFGALVKGDDTAVICFLLDTEIMPLCLHLMENGNELSKTVAAYILLKILQDGEGLGYVCVAADRFYAVSRVLRNLVVGLAEKPSPLLLKHIIKCFIRMSEDPRGRIALRDSLPEILMDGTFNNLLDEDRMLKRCLRQLLLNVHGSLACLQGTVFNILTTMRSKLG